MINSSSDYYFYYYYYYLVIFLVLLVFFGVFFDCTCICSFQCVAVNSSGVFTTFLVDRLLYYSSMYAAFTVITYIQQNHISLCECWMVSQLLL